MDDEEIKKILLERACREIDSLDKAEQEHNRIAITIKVQRLAYADQLILLLNDFNKHLCSIEIKGVINILDELYRRLNSGEPISLGVSQFMTAFYEENQKSVVFPSVDIIRNAIKSVVHIVLKPYKVQANASQQQVKSFVKLY